jgi:hypothetical protein
MNNLNIQVIQSVAVEVLKNIPQRPFFCLPLSALLYANLTDNHNIDAKLVTGDLTYKGQHIFKQDFKINQTDHSKFKLWAGHAWVEVENTVWDLSFFRSLYTEKFTKPYKNELIKIFGTGRGLLALQGRKMPDHDFEYHPVEFLTDDIATSIIQGIDQMLRTDW